MIVKTVLVEENATCPLEIDSISPVSETANDIRLESADQIQPENRIDADFI